MTVGNITCGTTEPTGGNKGDIYFQAEETTYFECVTDDIYNEDTTYECDVNQGLYVGRNYGTTQGYTGIYVKAGESLPAIPNGMSLTAVYTASDNSKIYRMGSTSSTAEKPSAGSEGTYTYKMGKYVSLTDKITEGKTLTLIVRPASQGGTWKEPTKVWIKY